VTLALRLRAKAGDGLARGMDAQLAAVEHLDAEDVEVPRGARPHDLREAADADAHQLAPGAPLGLLAAQLLVADQVHRLAQRGRVVATVVLPAQRRLIGKLVRLNEIPEAQFGRIHAQLLGQHVHHALDGVHGLGHAERTAVGHAAGRLVRIDGVDFDEGVLDVVGAGADRKQPGREFRRVGGRVGVAVVGQRLDPQRRDLAVLRGGQLGRDVVIARKRIGLQVFGPIFDPLDRLAQQYRGGDGDDVTRTRWVPCRRSRRRCPAR